MLKYLFKPKFGSFDVIAIVAITSIVAGGGSPLFLLTYMITTAISSYAEVKLKLKY